MRISFFRGGRLALLELMLFATAARAEPASDDGASITANVGPLRNAKGSVGCRLYTSPAGFPLTASGTQNQRVKIAGTNARCVFTHLAPGTYAITVHHDENDNGKFDKSALGLPLEGYGVSNNQTRALRMPRWEESKIVVERGKDLSLAISVRY